jgi:hypothetical protein
MKILVIPEVYNYLDELVTILYENDYFGFEDYALSYVDDLIDKILTTLPYRFHKPAPSFFDKLGKNLYYAVFKKSKRTSWYVFFTKYYENGEIIYVVKYIANNHTVAQNM